MKKFIKRLNIKPPSKKFWAREILIIIILTVISTSAYFINENRNSNIRSKIEKTEAELKVIQKKIDGYGGAFFGHWILLAGIVGSVVFWSLIIMELTESTCSICQETYRSKRRWLFSFMVIMVTRVIMQKWG